MPGVGADLVDGLVRICRRRGGIERGLLVVAVRLWPGASTWPGVGADLVDDLVRICRRRVGIELGVPLVAVRLWPGASTWPGVGADLVDDLVRICQRRAGIELVDDLTRWWPRNRGAGMPQGRAPAAT